MSSEEIDLANLARHVLARRHELDLSHEDVADRGGPSTTKMSQIENQYPTPPRRDVLKKLDKALEWHEGSARMVMLGKAPAPLPSGNAGGAADELRRQIQAAGFLTPEQKAEILAAIDRGTAAPGDPREVRGA